MGVAVGSGGAGVGLEAGGCVVAPDDGRVVVVRAGLAEGLGEGDADGDGDAEGLGDGEAEGDAAALRELAGDGEPVVDAGALAFSPPPSSRRAM